MGTSFAQMSDAELLSVTQQMITVIGAAPALYHTTAALVTALTTERTTFQNAVTAKAAADSAAQGATTLKNDTRLLLENLARLLRNTAKAGGTLDSDMQSAAIPVGGAPVGDPADKPVVLVNTSNRLHHTLTWTDSATPNSKKRPHNALGVEIWSKIDGPPPTDESECSFIAMDTASPYVVEYTGDEGGKMIHYLVRWLMKDGSRGTFGDTASATVPA